MDLSKRNLIYKIAKDYYGNNRTQKEIADRFGISRIMVSRLLSKALNEKIVEIKIHAPEDPNLEVERQLEKKYNLKEVIVVTCASDNYGKQLKRLGEAGVDFLLRNLQGNETISISWGMSLLALVNALPNSNYPEVQITQMIGGLGYPKEDMSGTELTRRMANAFNAKAKILNSPGIVKNEALCYALKAEPQVHLTLSKAKKADIALVGIGHFSHDSVLRKSDTILSEEDIKYLNKHGAVGDISLRFFDKEGNYIRGRINDRVVGLDMEEMRKIPRVIGIAGGEHKSATIHAALKGQLIDVLITDNKTAGILLKKY